MRLAKSGVLVQTLIPLAGVAEVSSRLGLGKLADLVTLAAVRGYQTHLSPYKGFSCAHRRLYGQASCSQYFRQLVATQGLSVAIPLFRERLQECHQANLTLRVQRLGSTVNPANSVNTGSADPTPPEQDEDPQRKPRQDSPSNTCLDNCDFGGCQGCDTSDFRACDLNRNGVLDGGDCSSCELGGCDAPDISGCGDCGSCGGP
jgi:putative component of membrane protein insertase Oxa1/YidC/SpoIIIJ protein YidD